jgi:protein-L-isoaspartate(D-aspartate) O-methyltransferase
MLETSLTMNVNLARFNMVQQQVRTWDVLDPRILELMTLTPREVFVPADFQQLAFSDTFIPIGYDQVMLPPKIVGRILQSLTLNKRDSVLQIGTGTGYLSALLCQLAKKITAVEVIPELAKQTLKNLKALGLHNFVLEVGDAVPGWPDNAPYDAIILTGSVPVLPKSLGEELAINGRLFAVIGKAPAMSAVLLTRVGKEQWSKQVLFETNLPSMTHEVKVEDFQF